MTRTFFAFAIAAVIVAGCGSSQQFAAVPAGIDTSAVPHQTVDMTARRYKFTPDEIHVKAGTLVTLRITALDGTHGFKLGAFGIDEDLEKNEQKTVTFFAAQAGRYDFKCSHFCGIGHFSMNGTIIVE